jgi:phosphoribosyl 1,2-cyclic phosphodiesterase
MKISSLSSGSSGNCFFIQEENSAVLIDAGISCKRMLEKLQEIKQSPKQIKAIFITHEHSDHTKGADVLARTLKIPIYATNKTIQNSFLCKNSEQIISIKNSETIKISNLEIEAFSKSHDGKDPVSFTIHSRTESKTTSIITDIGQVCNNVQDSISSSNFLAIEANHDLEMLQNGPYPYFLKQRISSNQGHISNMRSALSVLEHSKSKMKNLLLCHLSEKNNNPLKAMQTFQQTLKHRSDLKPQIRIAPRFSSSQLVRV